MIISLETVCTYARKLRRLAEDMLETCEEVHELKHLSGIAGALSNSPEHPARSFRECVQATWFALMVGEIQYGMHDVPDIGRADQYLYPLFKNDIESDRLTLKEALELLEELNLKLTANVSLVPEVGAEANGTLGVSQHCVIIGGADITNKLFFLMLDAHERIGGAINQLSVRVHKGSDPAFLKRGVAVFRKTTRLAFFNDDVIVPALVRNGLCPEDALDFNIVGCIETSGGGNCFGCPGGHEILLPAVLYMTLTNSEYPLPVFGQKRALRLGLRVVSSPPANSWMHSNSSSRARCKFS